jgi:hypothetical protein
VNTEFLAADLAADKLRSWTWAVRPGPRSFSSTDKAGPGMGGLEVMFEIEAYAPQVGATGVGCGAASAGAGAATGVGVTGSGGGGPGGIAPLFSRFRAETM